MVPPAEGASDAGASDAGASEAGASDTAADGAATDGAAVAAPPLEHAATIAITARRAGNNRDRRGSMVMDGLLTFGWGPSSPTPDTPGRFPDATLKAWQAPADTRQRVAPPAPAPNGLLFFVHGASETSEGLARNVARIEDQVRRRGLGCPRGGTRMAPAIRSPARELAQGPLPPGASDTDLTGEPADRCRQGGRPAPRHELLREPPRVDARDDRAPSSWPT